jgi:UDP-3-O-[3-hydroxymyristoyl] glucosamine N-acyltransferase
MTTEPEITLFEFGDGNGPVPAHRHPNGGGWVADTAHVAPTAFVGPDARVTGQAEIFEHARIDVRARIECNAIIDGAALVTGDAIVTGHAYVSGRAIVSGYACVTGSARVGGDAIVTQRAVVADNAEVMDAHLYERARIGGDCRISEQVYIAYVVDVGCDDAGHPIWGYLTPDGDIETIHQMGSWGAFDCDAFDTEIRLETADAILRERRSGRRDAGWSR